MKAFTSIFRIGHRRRVAPGSARKRPERSFASTFALLEGRALLSVVGPVTATAATTTLTTTTQALRLTISDSTPSPTQSAWNGNNGASNHGGQSGSSGSGSASGNQANPPPPVNQAGQAGSQSNPSGDHVAMDLARVTVDGQSQPEFALADFNASEVFVRLGGPDSPAVVLGHSQGINHPEAVTLADINGDGIPDLIVANTNGNDILIFPGLGDGQFGPEENGGQGIAVGADPISVTVNYIDNNPDLPQLIVANAESNSVSILNGQVTDGTWSATSVDTIQTPTLPVKTLLYDVNNDGDPDLLVCNSGSNDVTMYAGQEGGTFAPNPTATFAVGLDPDAMFVGSFDRRDQADLVTVNAGSDDLTFIGNAFGPQPVTQTVSSGGTTPDAAFAFDPGHTGVLDLVVANGGDGHLSLLKGGVDGLQLAGVITQSSVPAPTALAPASSGGNEFEFFAASAGDDAALLLSFDLGVASTYLPGTTGETAAIGQGDGDLIAELMPFNNSSMELIAVLWAGGGDSGATADEWTFRDPSSITSLYSPTEGQGVEEPQAPSEASKEPAPLAAIPVDPSKGDDTLCFRFILGVDEAFGRPREFVDAIAARDLDGFGDRPVDGLAQVDLERRRPDQPFDADAEAASGAIDEALRLFWSEGPTREGLAPGASTPRPESAPEVDGVDAPADEVRLEAVPLISTALLTSTRLILKASPPRPSAFRRKLGLGRFVSLEHDRQAGNRPGPV